MERTMQKYAEKIERNEVNPHFRYDGQASGLLLDPRSEDIPLTTLGFGIYQLDSDFATKETEEKEVVLVPQDGEFEAEVNGRRFTGGRPSGPFAAGSGKSNASALYIPCNATLRIRGRGEAAFFEAPALKEKPACYLPKEESRVVSRGEWVWRRDVVSLVSPKDASSNLVVGETYSPPGLWSGTPLHQHDGGQPLKEESDHEEIYYHRFNWVKKPEDQFGPYGVQLLMDGKRLMKAFIIGDKSIFAIPGGCHPVVASPVSELLYLWGLAGTGNELVMKDIPEFLYLKSFEEVFKELERDRVKRSLSREEFRSLCVTHRLTGEQAALLSATLREKGYEIE